MKLIVGLGNPGTQYSKTRHNAGFMVVDRLAEKHGRGEPVRARFQAATTEVNISGEKCLLMKPTTYMNRSGQSVGEAVRFFKSDPVVDVIVVVDDLYLPTGAVRLRPGGGTGGHNGLESISQLLARDDYPRLRVGVGQLPGGGKPAFIDQADFVLSRFTEEEEPLLKGAIDKGVASVETFIARGLAHAMNFANAGPQRERPPPKAAPPEQPRQTEGT
ncbi:MAG: aminoacyl-tRNA hydrolase [Planctomycetes bacterium]|nr:aminoacyl-tRNA hydrolase [Planctomycetota bacterium]